MIRRSTRQTTKRSLVYFGRMCRYYFQIPWSSSFNKSLPIGSFIVTPFLIDVNCLDNRELGVDGNYANRYDMVGRGACPRRDFTPQAKNPLAVRQEPQNSGREQASRPTVLRKTDKHDVYS